MAAAVRFEDAAGLLAAGFVFLLLCAGLGRGLARAGLTSREAGGKLQGRSLVVIAFAFTLLVFAFTMCLWWLDRFHPAVSAFYSAGGVILAITLRAPSSTAGAR